MTIDQLTTVSPEVTKRINQLAQQLSPNAQPLSDHDLQELIASPNTFLFLAKDEENNIAGMVTLVVYRIPYAKKAIIEDLVVDEAYRGEGVGSQLLQKALDEAKAQRAAYVDLTSQPHRIASNKLYEKFGFKKRNTNSYRFHI